MNGDYMSDKIRAFLSIDIDDERLLREIEKVQCALDRDAAKMKLVEIENIHLTWRFFGDTAPDKIDRIHKELESLTFEPFNIHIAGVGSFPNIRRPRVVWIGVSKNVDAVRNLKLLTDKHLSRLGYPIEKRKFIPHATIARIRNVKNQDAISKSISSLKDTEIGEMTVTTIRMKKSILTSTGPIYETLWDVPLRE